MADLAFADIDVRNNKNVRKALRGGLWLAPETADPIETLTVDSTVTPGTPTLAALPATYYGLGWINDAGAVFAEAIATSDINGWGGTEPVRRDITSDVTTVQVVGLETTKNTLATWYGVDPASIVPDATTGEVSILRASTPQDVYYRALVLGVDGPVGAEIYVAKFLPRVSISAKGGQTFSMGSDTGISYDMTFTAFLDNEVGTSERFLAGGKGWLSALADMGFATGGA